MSGLLIFFRAVTRANVITSAVVTAAVFIQVNCHLNVEKLNYFT